MPGWYHQLNRHDFQQAPGDNDGQGILAYCSPWSCKELDMSLCLNDNIFDSICKQTGDFISSQHYPGLCSCCQGLTSCWAERALKVHILYVCYAQKGG